MRKVLKVIGILFLLVILLIIAVGLGNAYLPVIPGSYTTKTETGGEIERRYLSMGEHKVSSLSVKREDSLKKILVFYPSDLKESENAYPVVIYSNGTGQKGSQYKNLYRHLASWGFIVLANDDPESYSGLPAEKTLAYILEENEKEGSIFYQKVDSERIGTYGHSQGGAAVFNTITAQEHSPLYKTAVSLSPTNEELADALGWHFDLNKVTIPVFIIAGTEGEFETETVIPLEKLEEMYAKLNVPKAMARRIGAAHADTPNIADGYVTAWFMWQLQGDEEAAKAFCGTQPELLNNPLYCDQAVAGLD
ncbi:MAG: alpha/beta hydrolase [Erysipelotrichaceae bacterium]|nr:alpha/beta hydrolase [Erysipelotrichaceae bacterium]